MCVRHATAHTFFLKACTANERSSWSRSTSFLRAHSQSRRTITVSMSTMNSALADVKLDRTTTLSGRSLAALSTAQESIVWSLVSVQRGYELTGTGMGASRGLGPRTRSGVLQRLTTSLCSHGPARDKSEIAAQNRGRKRPWPNFAMGWVSCAGTPHSGGPGEPKNRPGRSRGGFLCPPRAWTGPMPRGWKSPGREKG